MTIAQENRYYSTAEYLEQEVNCEERNEYIDGQIIPMTVGTPNHNQIVLNLSGTLNFVLKRQSYRVFVTDQRLWIPKKRIYTYPDVMVIAGALELAEGRRDTIINPLIIAEVLSSSTKNYDRAEKFAAYRSIDSFQEYLLIEQYGMHVEQYSKTDANHWIFTEYEGENGNILLNHLPFQISLLDLYDKVDFNLEK